MTITAFHAKIKYDRYASPEEFRRTVALTPGTIPAPTYFGGLNGPGDVMQISPLLARGGLALTLDLANPGCFKLAGAGDRIYARLESISAPVDANQGYMGMAAFRFGATMPIDPAGVAPAVGDTVAGSLKGLVAKAAANDPGINYVVAIIPTEARVQANGGPTEYAVVHKL